MLAIFCLLLLFSELNWTVHFQFGLFQATGRACSLLLNSKFCDRNETTPFQNAKALLEGLFIAYKAHNNFPSIIIDV
jgi:hypothetical protein